MSTPFLSIITINYNNAAGLRKTMQSVFDLEFTDYEYIIIDGGSTDESVELIRKFLSQPEYAKKISYWVSEPDKGVYNAMNKGLTHASGKLVNMMNSGDCFVNATVLNDLPAIYEKSPNSILYGCINQYKGNKFFNVYGYSITQIANANIPHQATFIPLALHKTMGFYDETYKAYADYDFVLRCLSNKTSIVYINKLIANYELGGISSSEKICRFERKILERKYPVFFSKDLPKNKIVRIKQVIKFFLPYGFIILFSKVIPHHQR